MFVHIDALSSRPGGLLVIDCTESDSLGGNDCQPSQCEAIVNSPATTCDKNNRV
jgi:hypothetical protein